MASNNVTNNEIAKVLEQIADLLEGQDANPYRVRAYRNGAATVRTTPQSLANVIEKKASETLRELPGIGESLSATIAEYIHTRRTRVLERLQGTYAPTDLFSEVPGIGERLAERIVEQLGINTLEALESAAHDGRLAQVEGFGPRRLAAVRSSLAGMLNQSARRRSSQRRNPTKAVPGQPSIALLLAIDAEYRRRAAADELQKIAPRRFNPSKAAWLPVMHTEQEGWEFTVLFSNTARAHELKATNDWVVVYYRLEGKGQEDEGQNTIVTEIRGPLVGKRVIRGREAECKRYYAEGKSVDK